ncbi:MAG: cytochrome c oxidase accessory protein CcoG [Halobacteriovoraceae bacterium]|nr:cytochrome c oxidase accessory protein CcoG [Halobacteriovoraceae bacterium]MCB9093939.1 cytochrome c oxidase accessory protein CcoG [Halobacteriovoraceae bacterium]
MSENLEAPVEERLATTDEHGNRVYVHPEDVHGQWKTRRRTVYWILISIYLILPWINIGGRQSVLIDIPNREFLFFGMHFWGHEIPYFFLFLAGFGFSIAFITAIWGRVWCGWACPQTVFIDTIYRVIERVVEGRSRRRMKLDASKWTFEKFYKRTLKWTLFTIVALITSHSFLGYFMGARNLLEILTHSPTEHWSAFTATMVFTGIILFDFGWFREQFCIIACPYGRFQSVFMDENSLVVAYDEKRGEPRRSVAPSKDQEGDCVNCYQCVRVCPTGIDIRRGTQLECIACTMCIDACDNIMERLDRPKGLIRYTTENELEGKKRKIFRPRIFIYLGVFCALILSASILFLNKDGLRAMFIRGNRDPYQLIHRKDQQDLVVNHYKVELFYQGSKKLNLNFEVDPKLLEDGLQLITPLKPFPLSASRKKVANLFIKFPPSMLEEGLKKISIQIKDDDQLITEKEVMLVGPIK